jgi:plasmid maintenance system antidote protein VapI
LLNGKTGLSGGTALRIEEAFAVKMDALMRMPALVESLQTRKPEKQIHAGRIHHLAHVRARPDGTSRRKEC